MAKKKNLTVTNSSIGRYWNLLRTIRNWPAYFQQKRSSTFQPARFTTRGTSVTFDVPTRELYLVFKEIFLTDFYSMASLAKKLPGNPVIVDVGANAGYFNMLLLSRRPDAKIFAYEPIEQNVALFRKNLDANPSVGKQVSLNHRAVTGVPTDHITLYKESDSDNSVTASVYKDFESHNLKEVKVKAVSLSQILLENKLEHVDLLKLDCEGSEYPIVYESPAEIWSKIDTVFLEVHNLDKAERNHEAMKKFLESKGYSTSSEVAINGCFALWARRK